LIYPFIRNILCAIALLGIAALHANAQTPPENAPPATPQTAPQSQTPPPTTPPQQQAPAAAQPQGQNPVPKKDDRMFYVMPNYLTVQNETQVKPLTVGQKFKITAEGTFDPYEFVVVGILAGIRQADNSSPGFGQGAAGYGKRYAAGFADQAIGNIMVGGVFPSILKTDPRYFQLGKGGFGHRFGYALSRIAVARKDSGGHTFNFSEFLGNGTATAISTLYYPAQDRSASSSLSNWGTQLAVDALGNELKEFWPDIHRKLSKKQ
jgi:hypothetical protein